MLDKLNIFVYNIIRTNILVRTRLKRNCILGGCNEKIYTCTFYNGN